jgi:hypothetical protein
VELKPQDVVMLLRILAYGTEQWTYSKLSGDLGISTSQLHMAVQRCVAARLIEQGAASKPFRTALKEFLVYGVKYTFPVERKGAVRGIPTGYAAPPLDKLIVQSPEPPPVWPYAKGSVRGISFLPLHRSVPEAAMKDPKLYEMLALLDAIRDGRAREREIAVRELSTRIDQAW